MIGLSQEGGRCILAPMNGPVKPRVAIIFTGGTISMRIDSAAGGAEPTWSGEEILAQVPGLEHIAEVAVMDFARLPGPHITPALMLELSRVITSQLADGRVHGVVVTHGTDTLEETALKRWGAILGGWLPSHKARIKLMLLLGAGRDPDEIRAAFGVTD